MTDETASLPAHTLEQKTVVFDPVVEWDKIEKQLEEDPALSFDERTKKRDKLIKQLATALYPLGLPFEKIFDSLISVQRARWALRKTQKINSKIFPGFEVDEMISLQDLTKILASGLLIRDDLDYLKNTGVVNERWVAINGADALAVSTGIIALAIKERIKLGRNAVDLGGGDGSWGIMLAKLGFNTIMIERDPTLVKAAQDRINALKEENIALAPIRVVQGEFHLKKEVNTSTINDILEDADLMVCYPWPDEVIDRLKLFKQYAKDDSILILYGSGIDGFRLDLQQIEELGLEIIGSKKETAEEQNKPIGFPALNFGSRWVMLKKVNT